VVATLASFIRADGEAEPLSSAADRNTTSSGPIKVKQDPFLPPWASLLKREGALWKTARERASNGPRILVANSVPSFYNSTNLESLLAVALTLRGAQVHILLCDKALSACMNTKFRKVSPDSIAAGTFREPLCDVCVQRGSAFSELGLSIHFYSQYLTQIDHDEICEIVRSVPPEKIPSYRYEGLPVGEHAYAGCLRYYSTGTLEDQYLSNDVLKRYFEAALGTTKVMLRLTSHHDFEAACFHHGIYIPQGVVGEVCRSKGIRVSTWNTAYRERCFVFSHEDTYHHTLLDEPVSAWKDMTFTDRHDQEIRQYIESRWLGSQDWIYFHDTPDDSLDTLVQETGVDIAKPIIGMLTNVMWDAQLHYRQNAFPGMLDWILETVEYFRQQPNLQLLIRVHPAELRGIQASRQFVVDEIRKAYSELPANVFVIPPGSNINTYAAMLRCNCVLIYGTKTGVELTSMGIPVIVAGEAWIRNKGLTIDVTSREEYQQVLKRLPLAESRLTEQQVREARKYAYHFFLRRMIPINSIVPTSEEKIPFKVSIESLEKLLPGIDEGLDLVCDGIMNGTPYIYRSEEK
tara:strand:+ start:486 stop:2210 length:1725 start_codon:yes stop_codon:yes gene_type:complete